jgi:U3 small nucleolar RNA-associated protein 15
MIVSGSYDQTVRVWDTRQAGGRSALTFKFGSPIEDVVTLNASVMAVAAGNEVSIVNLIAGQAEHVIKSHQKTVTSLSSAQNGTRILTGGLDGHVKIHNTASWEVVAGFKYPSPILSLAVVPAAAGSSGERDDRHLAVGLSTGLISLRTRLAGAEKAKVREREMKMQALVAGEADEYERKQRKKDLRQGIKARDRGKDYKGEGADIIITGNERPRQKKLKDWQRSLRSGEYAKALDQVIPLDSWRRGFSKDDLMTLLTVLRHRSALRTALANRTADRLVPTMSLIHKYIGYPRYINILYDVMLILVDLYSHKFAEWQGEEGNEREVLTLVHKIKSRVRQAADFAASAHRTLGMIDFLESG